ELQVHHRIRTAANSELLLLNLHSLPTVLRFVLQRIRRIELFDVEVLLVEAEDGESPSDMFIVPESYPRQSRLARTDDVPAGRDQVDHVAQRRLGNNAMRIVGQQRLAGVRQGTRNRPVVAFFKRVWREFNSGIAAHEIAEKAGPQASEVYSWGGIELHRGIQLEKS